MTAIVALVQKNRVWMGGDSAFSTDDEVWIQRDPKVFRRGDALIGVCGLARFEALMRYAVDFPRLRKNQDVGQWCNVDLAAEIRKAHQQDGYTTEPGYFIVEDSQAIIGIAGSLFVMESDLCFWRPIEDFAAIGSGQGPARTSLYETAKLQPRTRLKRALERAAQETTGVRPPYTFDCL